MKSSPELRPPLEKTGIIGSRKNKADLPEWVGIAIMAYLPLGVAFLCIHKDDSIPTWGWWALYAVSPVILAGGTALFVAAFFLLLLPVLFVWKKFRGAKLWGRYESALSAIENRSNQAHERGGIVATWGLRILWFVVAIPIIALLMLFCTGGLN